MDKLGAALKDTEHYSLPPEVVAALRDSDTDVACSEPPNIAGAVALIKLRHDIPLDAIEAIAQDSLNDLAFMDMELSDPTASISGTQQYEEEKAEMRRLEEMITRLHTDLSELHYKHDETSFKDILEDMCGLSKSQLNVVMEKTADLFANLSDVSLQVVCNTVMSLKAFSQLTQAMRTDLLGGILLPKLRDANTEATRILQEIILNVAQQETYAYAHGIVARWILCGPLRPWQADMIRRTFQQVPMLYQHLDTILEQWIEQSHASKNDDTCKLIWDDTLFTLITHWLSDVNRLYPNQMTLCHLVQLFARQSDTIIQSPKFGLCIIALTRRLLTIAQERQKSTGGCASLTETTQSLSTIASRLRAVQGRTLQQYIKQLEHLTKQ